MAIAQPSYAAELYEQMRSWPPDPDLPGGNLTNATGVIANAWARRDSKAAVAWLLSLEAGPASDNALSQGAVELARHAPHLTAKIFAEMTSGEHRDRAASGIVNRHSYGGHPQIAFEWSQKIEDDTLRQRMTREVFRRIKSEGDFQGARELVDRANLTEAQKTKFLQRIQNAED